MDIFNTVIIWILGVMGIRDIIATTGFVPVNKKYSWIIYGKYDEKIIQRVLSNLGYGERESNKIIAGMTKREQDNLASKNPEECCKMLINVIKDCIINTGNMLYGTTPTNYYIDTMGGSQEEKTLKVMADLIIYMILYNVNNKKTPKPDYIIVPKNGNPLLGKYIADKFGIKYILHKNKDEKSRANPTGNTLNEYELDFEINYEGVHRHIGSAEYRNKKLRGVVLDCNTSGGTQLLDAADGFNKLIAIPKLNLKFAPITDIYTLFKVDDLQHREKNIDDKFKDNKYKLYRYFDLNEDIKKNIYENRSNPDNDVILETMKRQNLLKTEDFQ